MPILQLKLFFLVELIKKKNTSRITIISDTAVPINSPIGNNTIKVIRILLMGKKL